MSRDVAKKIKWLAHWVSTYLSLLYLAYYSCILLPYRLHATVPSQKLMYWNITWVFSRKDQSRYPVDMETGQSGVSVSVSGTVMISYGCADALTEYRICTQLLCLIRAMVVVKASQSTTDSEIQCYLA